MLCHYLLALTSLELIVISTGMEVTTAIRSTHLLNHSLAHSFTYALDMGVSQGSGMFYNLEALGSSMTVCSVHIYRPECVLMRVPHLAAH